MGFHEGDGCVLCYLYFGIEVPTNKEKDMCGECFQKVFRDRRKRKDFFYWIKECFCLSENNCCICGNTGTMFLLPVCKDDIDCGIEKVFELVK